MSDLKMTAGNLREALQFLYQRCKRCKQCRCMGSDGWHEFSKYAREVIDPLLESLASPQSEPEPIELAGLKKALLIIQCSKLVGLGRTADEAQVFYGEELHRVIDECRAAAPKPAPAITVKDFGLAFTAAGYISPASFGLDDACIKRIVKELNVAVRRALAASK